LVESHDRVAATTVAANLRLAGSIATLREHVNNRVAL
jgi:hypothetical protein